MTSLLRESGMTSFADWLRYYNNLDVGPFIEALQKMKTFYGERGIDICKDAVSLPGISLPYLLTRSDDHVQSGKISLSAYYDKRYVL